MISFSLAIMKFKMLLSNCLRYESRDEVTFE